MPATRRALVAFAGLALSAGAAGSTAASASSMYGLIGRMKAVPGRRDALARILLRGVSGMPGCLSYVVAEDQSDADALWITEVWASKEHHKASLELPSVRHAIAEGRPLISAFEEQTETLPLGGHGLTS